MGHAKVPLSLVPRCYFGRSSLSNRFGCCLSAYFCSCILDILDCFQAPRREPPDRFSCQYPYKFMDIKQIIGATYIKTPLFII